MISILPLLLMLATAGCALPSATHAPAPGTSARPNIVLFLVDDMGWQDTSVPFWTAPTPLNKKYRTPNMERLASQGMKFTQAYAYPVCSPTRVSLMTGFSSARHRVTNWTLHKDRATDAKHPRLLLPEWNVNGLSPVPGIPRTVVQERCLPQCLRDAGYRTIMVGKAHFGAIGTPAADPKSLGFDVNIGGHAAGGPGSYLGEAAYGNKAANSPWGVPHLEKYHGTDTFLTEALTREALAAMDEAQEARKPFFLYLAHYAVHVPFAADKRFIETYKKAGLDNTEAMYAALVEGMDKSLGDILDYLERRKLDGNTLVLFMSDNGGISCTNRGGKPDTHNLPLACGKGSSREGGIREPMLAKWPGVTQPGSVCDDYLIIEDFYPTLLEAAGAAPNRDVDGVSFVPLLKGQTGLSKGRALVWHMPNNWGPGSAGYGAVSAVRLDDWKYIFYHDPGRKLREELFNLREDIGERNNLAGANPDKLRALRAILKQHLSKVDAQFPTDRETGKRIEIPE